MDFLGNTKPDWKLILGKGFLESTRLSCRSGEVKERSKSPSILLRQPNELTIAEGEKVFVSILTASIVKSPFRIALVELATVSQSTAE